MQVVVCAQSFMGSSSGQSVGSGSLLRALERHFFSGFTGKTQLWQPPFFPSLHLPVSNEDVIQQPLWSYEVRPRETLRDGPCDHSLLDADVSASALWTSGAR